MNAMFPPTVLIGLFFSLELRSPLFRILLKLPILGIECSHYLPRLNHLSGDI